MIARRPLSWVGALALLVPAMAQATLVADWSFEELTARVPVVVRATVHQQESRWDEHHRRIQTFTELAVTERLKGEVPEVILVRQPGGVVGDIGQRVSGAARFEPGEDVVLFLERPPDDRGVFIVSGLSAGKVRLEKGPLGVIARRDLRGIAFYGQGPHGEARVRERNDDENLGPAEAFLARIRRAVAKGAAR